MHWHPERVVGSVTSERKELSGVMQYAAWLLEDDAPGAVVQWSGSSAEVDVKCGGSLL